MDNIHIVTARGQSPEEFAQLFDKWQHEKVIRYAQGYLSTAGALSSHDAGKINVYPVGLGEGLLHGEGITQRKVMVVRDQIIPHYLLLGKQQQKRYVVVIAENDPGILRAYERMLREISGIPDFQKYLEFILLHAGAEEDVRLSGLPGRWTRVSNQALMSLTPEAERLLSHFSKSKNRPLRVSANSCKSIFGEGSL